MNSKLVIITGASSAVGKGFVDHFLPEENTTCVEVSRSPMETEAIVGTADGIDLVNMGQS